MGTYFNPKSYNFQRSLNSEIYVDKSRLIAFTNRKLNTQQSYICVSRPRRFGKSMAADMLAAYYTCEQDNRPLFENLAIKEEPSFEKHLNKYNVVKIDMQNFMSSTSSVEEMLNMLSEKLRKDCRRVYPDIFFEEEDSLEEILMGIFVKTERQFVLLIDEWDCVMRRYDEQMEQKRYLDFLRNMTKDQPYIALAYMTGILPIKKYGEHSALNMFYEYSMMDSAEISDCFGFTEEEVCKLCEEFHMDFEEVKEWYDGYHLSSNVKGAAKDYSIYSPKSVVEAMLRNQCEAYWNQTETYEALKEYIQMNMDGLKDAIIEMLSGESISINTRHFQNDMISLETRDDILTLLLHLGYLSYDQKCKVVRIPNKEVSQEFIASIQKVSSYHEVSKAVIDSKDLLEALWNMDSKAIETGVEKAHQEISIIEYNDENSLCCALQLAFYYAREYYTIIRELPAGKGYADICLIPRQKHMDKPAAIIELKWDKTAETAINQIREKRYPDALKDYQGRLLLCGINYDKKQKSHQCIIEMLHV